MESTEKVAVSALSVSDVLLHIFSFSNKNTLAACARVSKSWSDNALDELWKNMTSLVPIFSILSPLSKDKEIYYARDPDWKYYYAPEYNSELDSDGENVPPDESCFRYRKYYNLIYSFTEDIRPADFRRLIQYTIRIRSIEIPSLEKKVKFSETMLLEFVLLERMSTQQSNGLFPRLTNLTLDMTARDRSHQLAILFLSDSLSTITVTVSRRRNQHVLLFMHEIRRRCPKLKSIYIRDKVLIYTMDWFEELLVESLPKLHSLESITLPPAFTTAVAYSLSTLPLLKVIALQGGRRYRKYVYNSLRAKLRTFSPKLQHESYPSLKDISIISSLSNVVEFLREGAAPYLELLSVSVDDPEDALSLRNFLIFLSQNRSPLTSLYMDLSPCRDSKKSSSRQDDVEDMKGIYALTFSALKPISCLSSLTSLTIFYHHVSTVTNEELGMLVAPLPRLLALHFCRGSFPKHSQYRDEPLLTFGVLPILADRLPLLRTLSLHVRCVLDAAETMEAPDGLPSFQSLERLHFMRSPIGNDVLSDSDSLHSYEQAGTLTHDDIGTWTCDDLGIYLSKVLPSTCEILWGDFWYPGSVGVETREESWWCDSNEYYYDRPWENVRRVFNDEADEDEGDEDEDEGDEDEDEGDEDEDEGDEDGGTDEDENINAI